MPETARTAVVTRKTRETQITLTLNLDGSGKADLHTGIGFGARWRSPVGPVRVDVAHGLNHPDSKFQLYLNVGAEF